jgi:hypothetical protein
VGDVINQETIISQHRAAGGNDLTDAAEIVGRLRLTSTSMFFCKCQSFSTGTWRLMKNNCHLIVRYKNNTLGELRLCLESVRRWGPLLWAESVRARCPALQTTLHPGSVIGRKIDVQNFSVPVSQVTTARVCGATPLN